MEGFVILGLVVIGLVAAVGKITSQPNKHPVSMPLEVLQQHYCSEEYCASSVCMPTRKRQALTAYHPEHGEVPGYSECEYPNYANEPARAHDRYWDNRSEPQPEYEPVETYGQRVTGRDLAEVRGREWEREKR